MENIKARFEFRTFDSKIGLPVKLMRQYSKVESIRESHELYIVSDNSDKHNTKIRNGLLDIKEHINSTQGLEQWMPLSKEAFPLSPDYLRNTLFPAFNLRYKSGQKANLELKGLINLIYNDYPDLCIAKVFKRRFGFTIDSCIVEYAEILINGAAIESVCIESTMIEEILKLKTMLCLDEYKNINYLKAIKTICGRSLPDIDEIF